MALYNFWLLLICVVLMFDEVSLYKHKYKRARPRNRYESRNQKLQNKKFPSVVNIYTPQQIHISFGSKPTDIVIVWATDTKDPKMEVQYSASTKISDMPIAIGQQIELQKANEKGARYWHRALLPNLKPGKEYFYRFSSKKSGAKSDVFQFTVPSMDVNQIHSYMVLADMGTITKNLKFIVHEAKNKKYTSVFHIGDIGYDLHKDKGSIGDKFLNQIQTMTSCIPYLVSPGDHESGYDFVQYRHRFSMPNSNWPMKTEEMYYSFDLGATHFISLNTELFFNNLNADKQLLWLKADLEKVNKIANRPWVIVMGHRPLYSSCDHRPDCLKETPVMRKKLEDIFFRYGVDVYIGGHYHNYERTWPVYKNKVVARHYKHPKAPVYITVGTLGIKYISETINKPSGIWSAKRLADETESYGVLDVLNTTHLHWKLFAAANNAKLDSMWIIQKNKQRFGDPKKYLAKKVIVPELPPEPIILVNKPPSDSRLSSAYHRPYLYMKRGVIFKDSGLIVALITVGSFVFFVCIFSKKLWRR